MGAFVAVDGPNGVGKTTAIQASIGRLEQNGLKVHATKEPTLTPLGRFIKKHDGHMASENAYACLVAADRWEHAKSITDLRQHHDVVLTDRYLPSSLVLNVARGVSWQFIIHLHEGLLRPDLTVILTADEGALRHRFASRGLGETKGELLTTRLDEARRYRELPDVMRTLGYEARLLDTTHLDRDTVAARLTETILEVL